MTASHSRAAWPSTSDRSGKTCASGCPARYWPSTPGSRVIGGLLESASIPAATETLARYWVLCVVPLLMLTMSYLLLELPAATRDLWLSGSHAAGRTVTACAARDFPAAAVSAVGAALAILSVVGSLYIVAGLARRGVTAGQRWSAGYPARRAAVLVAGAALAAGLAAYWTARGQFSGW